jgi:catechol 2,3-dioxygenase-like lactoylglutathione lyase family enzyme
MDEAAETVRDARKPGPPKFEAFDHVSLPCRDLEEGKRFYTDVLGAEFLLEQGPFAYFQLADKKIGIGSVGCTFVGRTDEYPHIAFTIAPGELSGLKEWLTACGVPSSNFWTRRGIEALMFFRDPSGNLIELVCESGFPGAEDLPRGPARGHGTAIDAEAFHYDRWRVPA